MKKLSCIYCNRLITANNYNKHVKSHEPKNNTIINKYHLDHEDLFCKFCHKECKNKNALVQHECRCKLNPNKYNTLNHKGINNPMYGKSAWNKGLNKSDNRILKIINTFHKNEILGLHKHVKYYSNEALQKLRNNPKMGGIRKNSGYGLHGYYKNYYCASTYELVFVIYCIDHNINFKRNTTYYLYKYNNKLHKYYPDFEIDNTLYEIKGWHNKLVDIKLKAVTDKPIKILYKEDMIYMFDYVKSNYQYKTLTDLYDYR